MIKSLLAISIGAAAGACLRWLFGNKLNVLLPNLPLGTLAANLVGAYIIGLAIAFFAVSPDVSPAWRLFIITGFCGGLTTFSTFSAETISLIQQGRPMWVLGIIAMHVAGSLLMTGAGLLTFRLFHA